MLKDAPGRLRQLLAERRLLWGPGVYDGISARIAVSVGFPILYMTGAGTAASRIGMPDLGLTTLGEMVENARTIARVSDVPVIADADTGFGDTLNVVRTVYEYERAGVAGIHIEDQVFPKRCGHLEGKAVVPARDYLRRIRAAARERTNPDFVIIARTDARQPHGFDAAMDRIKGAFEAGADVGFLEGPESLAEIERTVAEAPGPMLLNLAAHGKTPNLRVAEVERLGFKLAIYPAACMIPAALAIGRALQALKRDGTDAEVTESRSPRDFFALVGLEEQLELDAAFGGSTLTSV
ncbi:carboxyvinyl-carboxyphosphonate phosphorylmutase [bacterium]|nr:MAG: carboxyvinyl-carboxyphosphonate phosphorylmutase [bacterium]